MAQRIIFVGVHNKPHLTALCSSTRSGFISSFFFISTAEKENIILNEEINKLNSETKHLINRINAYKSVISRLNKKYKL